MSFPKCTDRSHNHPFARTRRESRIIAQAVQILDQRFFQRGEQLDQPGAVADFLKIQLAHQQSEVFGVIFLDTKLRLLKFEQLFYGSIKNCEIHPREVVKRALAHNAGAVILTHNHPSGNTTPSEADRSITNTLVSALKLIDVTVLDHFIVGKGKACSLAELGWL
jgi:DNA repair protein RadC